MRRTRGLRRLSMPLGAVPPFASYASWHCSWYTRCCSRRPVATWRPCTSSVHQRRSIGGPCIVKWAQVGRPETVAAQAVQCLNFMAQAIQGKLQVVITGRCSQELHLCFRQPCKHGHRVTICDCIDVCLHGRMLIRYLYPRLRDTQGIQSPYLLLLAIVLCNFHLLFCYAVRYETLPFHKMEDPNRANIWIEVRFPHVLHVTGWNAKVLRCLQFHGFFGRSQTYPR
mmetsp:Transcript_44840/g.100961  ORF Transcript_44840/g.100961 Transcript_44840/m.100961 type:complete len:226 (+) Transcript_44840:144-821(+)